MVNENENKDGEQNKDNKDNNSQVDTSKEELASIKAENEKYKRDLEDIRMEVMTPEYLEFLNSKGTKKEEPRKESNAGDDPYKNLSPRQIAEKIKEELKQEMKAEVKKEVLDDVKAEKQADINKEVQSFSKKHEDFELYRPTMYGLSLDPKNKDLSLSELYEEAKAHVKRIHNPPTQKEKETSRRSTNEKPSGSNSGSFKNTNPDKDKNPQEIANEVWDEVVGKDGLTNIS